MRSLPHEKQYIWKVMSDNGLAHITKSEVKFKFIDGEGLHAILVDANQPQANALGAYLVTRNRLDTSGIREMDPKLILLNILHQEKMPWPCSAW
jgi:hypothetical protein